MKTGYKVSDAMTHEPVFVGPEENIVECAKRMRDHNVGSVLVTQGDKVLGICTEDDIIRRVIAEDKSSREVKAGEVINTNVRTIDSDKDIFEAIMKMRDLNLKRLPVVSNGKFVGLLTMKDILKIEPQLFDMLVNMIDIREEERKPISRIGENEGICQICGSYADELIKNIDGVLVCDTCNED